ncbi:hypothetical protein [Rhizobium sp. L1K21]|uniref:hypothetical protein n=1 Tax=Rhizobium sp. L1K21 TaxID=2954933 RepID=UPI0020934D58|nr:hypothetical protein [Rhizobium sp. L1K21]MCO6184589.1 hypothetical protein [Rhizobium sp. L1K21]
MQLFDPALEIFHVGRNFDGCQLLFHLGSARLKLVEHIIKSMQAWAAFCCACADLADDLLLLIFKASQL